MSFIVNLRSDLSLKGFPPKREPGSSVHVADGVEDNNLEPGSNVDNNNTNQNFTLKLFTDPGKQSLGGVTPSPINNKNSIFIKGDETLISDNTDIGFNSNGSNTNQGFKFENNIDPSNQSYKGKKPQEYNVNNSIFIFGDESGLNDTNITGFLNTNINQGLRFAQGIDPSGLSLGGGTPTFIRNKDSIFIKGDDSIVSDETDIGFNTDGSNVSQGFEFEYNIDPGKQSREGKTPPLINNKNSIFIEGDDSTFPDETEPGFNINGSNIDQGFKFKEGIDPTGLSLEGVKPREYDTSDSRFIGNDGSPGLVFEEEIDPGGQSRKGKTPPKFTDTPYSQHVDNPTDPNQVLGIIDKELSVEPRSRTNTVSDQIGVLAKKRLDDVARITTKVINPIENPRFITNQGIIAFATALDASLKASGVKKLSAFGKAAIDGGLNIVKTYSGILASTPVAGTGIHLIFPPAVNNQYLQQNKEDPTRLLNNIAAFTGITAGSGINGANQAYTKGEVQKGLVTSNFVELDEDDNNKVKKVIKESKHDRDKSHTTFFSTRNNPVDLQYTYASSSGKIEDTFVNTVHLGAAPPLQFEYYVDTQNNMFFKDTVRSAEFVESIGLRTKLVSTGLHNSGSSLDVVSIESITIDQETESSVVDDIIPFNVEIYDPQQPVKYSLIKLRAYLDSMSDSYTGEWNGTKYVGRAEQLYNYTGFNRDFSFAFKVAALSKQELTPLYNKLNTLVSTTAPAFNITQDFMQGIFVKLTIGDYLHKVPGFFEKIGLTWDTKYPWELGIEDSNMKILPHILNVDVTFRPIHNFNPKYGSTFIGKVT